MGLSDGLYRQVIMEHYKNPRNKGLKNEEIYRSLHLRNPSCGDDVTIQVKVEDNKIKDIRHEGTGCSICCSSASVMSDLLKNKTVEEADNLIHDFYHLIKGENVKDLDELDEAVAFSGVAQFPARVKCAALSWRALDTLLHGQEGENNE